ncbi:MAG TPA: phosphoenolpyruvate--protein phosphotransferase [Stellaceae bacterium]|nr:phosphoenolpyruvate--protein phosphotransferase [Stellaceae bacterium]
MKSDGQERILIGLAISPGIAIGPVFVSDDGAISVPEYRVAGAEIEAERKRLGEAVALSLKQLNKLKVKAAGLPGAAAEEAGYLLDAHVAMLTDSRLVRGADKRVAEEGLNAERAVQVELGLIGSSFAAMDDAYLAARGEDIRVVGARLIRNLTKTPYAALQHLPTGTIIVAEELTPADTALIDPRRVSAIATAIGGAEGHTAIMARALALPAVLGVADLLRRLEPGDTIIVDGGMGRVVINPTAATRAHYERLREELEVERRRLSRFRRLPAVTRDGAEIILEANLELPRERELALAAGAQGLGLVRTEFLYMNRDDLPDEDDQYAAYAALVRGMDGKPVTLRTLDIGGDKLTGTIVTESANPALGLRAVRLALKDRRLLDVQLAAMLRAATVGKVRILVPMVANVDEIRTVRAALHQAARRLKRRGVAVPDPLPPLGIMIEIPGAALAADALAAEAEFFSIGTNDLIQYTLAIDRGDEQVAYLYNPLHPAVLRLIQFAVEAAMRARIPVNLCGEMAGDLRYTALLLGLGLRNLSMAPTNIGRVKERIRTLDLRAATQRARAVMDQTDDARIAALVDDFNELHGT